MSGDTAASLSGRWVAIEGVVGAGKTTTATLLSQRCALKPALERLDEHPFLDAYYRNPSRYAVETELAFMLIQVRQVRASLSDSGLVTDFAPAKNMIFAGLELDGDELHLLEMADAALWRGLPRPDMAVLLDVPLEVCRERLVERGRSYEQGLDVGDLARIRDGYLRAVSSLGADVRRIELSGVESPEEVTNVVVEATGLGSGNLTPRE